jgi:hypothetical protein
VRGGVPALMVGALLITVRSRSPSTAQSLASKNPGCHRRSVSAGLPLLPRAAFVAQASRPRISPGGAIKRLLSKC